MSRPILNIMPVQMAVGANCKSLRSSENGICIRFSAENSSVVRLQCRCCRLLRLPPASRAKLFTTSQPAFLSFSLVHLSEYVRYICPYLSPMIGGHFEGHLSMCHPIGSIYGFQDDRLANMFNISSF